MPPSSLFLCPLAVKKKKPQHLLLTLLLRPLRLLLLKLLHLLLLKPLHLLLLKPLHLLLLPLLHLLLLTLLHLLLPLTLLHLLPSNSASSFAVEKADFMSAFFISVLQRGV
ncbi:MAG: hypothetical protein V4446_04335 [Pseudomonadota bacterium]